MQASPPQKNVLVRITSIWESRASLRLKENRVVPGCQGTPHNATYPFLRFSTYLLTMSLQIVDIVLVRKHE